jgi:soluble lytic murein transglycosylase-like protein
MQVVRISAVFFLVASLLGLAAPAGANIYTYVDEDGVINFTNVYPQQRNARRYIETSRVRTTPPHIRVGRPRQSEWDAHIFVVAARYSVDPALVRAIIHAESLFNPQAVSPKGAQGLMQLMPQTAAMLEVADSFDPRANIEGGVRYFRYLLNRFEGDTRLSLAAYNAGPTAVQRHNGIPPFRETRDYVVRVLALYDRYRDFHP